MKQLLISSIFIVSTAWAQNGQPPTDVTPTVIELLRTSLGKQVTLPISNVKFFVADEYIKHRTRSHVVVSNPEQGVPIGDFFSVIHSIYLGDGGQRPPSTEILVGGQFLDRAISAKAQKTLAVKLLVPLQAVAEEIQWRRTRQAGDSLGGPWPSDSIWYTGLGELVAHQIAHNNRNDFEVIFNRRYATAAALMAMIVSFDPERRRPLEFYALTPLARDKAINGALERFCPHMADNAAVLATPSGSAGKLMNMCLSPDKYRQQTRSAEINTEFFRKITQYELGHPLYSLVWMEIMMLKGVEAGGLFKNIEMIACNDANSFNVVKNLHAQTRSSLWKKFSQGNISDGTTALYMASLLFFTSPKRADMRKVALCGQGGPAPVDFVGQIVNNASDEQFQSFRSGYSINLSGEFMQNIDISKGSQYLGRLVIAGLQVSDERSGLSDVTDSHIGRSPGSGLGQSNLASISDIFSDCKNIEKDLAFLAKERFIWVTGDSDLLRTPPNLTEAWHTSKAVLNINPGELAKRRTGRISGYPEEARNRGDEFSYPQISIKVGKKIQNLRKECKPEEAAKLDDNLRKAFISLTFRAIEGRNETSHEMTISHGLTLNVRMPSGAAERMPFVSVAGPMMEDAAFPALSKYHLIGYDKDFKIISAKLPNRSPEKLGDTEDIVMYILSSKHVLGEDPLIFYNDVNLGFYFAGSDGDDGGGSGAPDIDKHYPVTHGDIPAFGKRLTPEEKEAFANSGKSIEMLARTAKAVPASRIREHDGIVRTIWQLPAISDTASIKIAEKQFKIYNLMRMRAFDDEAGIYYYFANDLMPEAASLAFAFYLAGSPEGVRAVMADMKLLYEMGTLDAQKSMSFLDRLTTQYDPYYWALLFLTHYCGMGSDNDLTTLQKNLYKANSGRLSTIYPEPNFTDVAAKMRSVFGKKASPLSLVKIATFSTREKRTINP